MKSDEVYLGRIRDSIGKITRTVSSLSEAEFAQSETATASVILWLTQIGELAKRLSSDAQVRHPAPWREIMGFRDVAVHEYFDLSVHDVWLTATRDIPELLVSIGESES